MFGTFNMGVGRVVVCDEKDAETILNLIDGSMNLGSIQKSEEKIKLS
jgi:phosphoribosylformylglycinamidine cyclo-ligase